MSVSREGRGGWTDRGKPNGSIYYKFESDLTKQDGYIPQFIPYYDDAYWYDRVSRGVEAIQRLLTLQGHAVPFTGIFDEATDAAVRAFQETYVPPVDGLVGMNTMTALMVPIIESAARGAGFHPRWLYGQCRKESGMDPGAQGELHWQDSGLFQFNLEPRVTDKKLDVAYHPVKAAKAAATRFAAALDHFSGKGPQLRIQCSIAQHNNPSGAQAWFDSGVAPYEGLQDYVDETIAFAQQWGV